MHSEHTAFEKRTFDEGEAACELTVASDAAQQQRFATHRLRYAAFKATMTDWMKERALLSLTNPDALSYLDEFHYTSKTAEVIAVSLAERLASARDSG